MINFDDRSFRFGDGLFETVRVDDSGPVALRLHMARFERSARMLGYPLDSLRDGLIELERLRTAAAGIWRITVSRDDPKAPFGGSGTVDVMFRARTPRRRPGLCAIPGYFSPDLKIAEHKTTSWIRSIEARRYAIATGYDDAVLITPDDVVGEATSSNLFVVVRDEIVTPPVEGILPGTARARVLAAAKEELVPITERRVTLAELRIADEIVLTNAVVLAISAASFEGRGLDDQCGRQFRTWLEARG